MECNDKELCLEGLYIYIIYICYVDIDILTEFLLITGQCLCYKDNVMMMITVILSIYNIYAVYLLSPGFTQQTWTVNVFFTLTWKVSYNVKSHWKVQGRIFTHQKAPNRLYLLFWIKSDYPPFVTEVEWLRWYDDIQCTKWLSPLSKVQRFSKIGQW